MAYRSADPASLEPGLAGRASTLGDKPLAAGRQFQGMDALIMARIRCMPGTAVRRRWLSGPAAAGQPLAVRSGRASARRERGSGRYRRASWRDGPGRPPTGRRWPRLDFPPGLTTGCAGTRRSAAGTKESSDCGSLRRGSRSPGGWSRRAPRRQGRPSRYAGAGSAPR